MNYQTEKIYTYFKLTPKFSVTPSWNHLRISLFMLTAFGFQTFDTNVEHIWPDTNVINLFKIR